MREPWVSWAGAWAGPLWAKLGPPPAPYSIAGTGARAGERKKQSRGGSILLATAPSVHLIIRSSRNHFFFFFPPGTGD